MRVIDDHLFLHIAFEVSERILLRLRHTLYCLLKQGKCATHISAELEELISGCGKLDWDDSLMFLLCVRCRRLSLHFWEFFQVNAHTYIDVQGLSCTSR